MIQGEPVSREPMTMMMIHLAAKCGVCGEEATELLHFEDVTSSVQSFYCSNCHDEFTADFDL